MHLTTTMACKLIVFTAAVTTPAYLSDFNCFVCVAIFLLVTGGVEMSEQGEQNKTSARMR